MFTWEGQKIIFGLKSVLWEFSLPISLGLIKMPSSVNRRVNSQQRVKGLQAPPGTAVLHLGVCLPSGLSKEQVWCPRPRVRCCHQGFSGET